MKRRRAQAASHGLPLFAESDDALRDDALREVPADASQNASDPWPPAHVLAGIDEAGLGPMLGPLTTGGCAFRVPPGTSDLWPALEACVARDVEQDRGRIIVADSKVVFTRNPRGERRLETTALAFLAQRDRERTPPADGRALLQRCGVDVEDGSALASEAWFPHLAVRLPASVESCELGQRIDVLRSSLESAHIELTTALVRVLSVTELNASFARTHNKSLTQWDETRAALAHLWMEHAHEGLDVVVDRQGGRRRYGALLAEAFPRARIERVSETRSSSEYRVSEEQPRSPFRARADTRRHMRLTVRERAEDSSFAVALASCLAKYAREICMRAFNVYFGALQPGLKPTAGYVTDARRWLAEASTAIELSGLSARDLVRQR